MIRLADMNQDELEQFERRIKKGFYKSGVTVAYHEGCFEDEVGFTPLGKLMWRLHELGKVELFQKKLDHNLFQYLGYVK